MYDSDILTGRVQAVQDDLKNLKGHMPNHARTLGTVIDHWVIAAGCTKPTAKLMYSSLGERRVGIDAIITA